MAIEYIYHITLTTGHCRKSPRSEITDEAIKIIKDWLKKGLEMDTPIPLPVPDLSHFAAKVLTDKGALVVTVYGPLGPHVPGRPAGAPELPLISMGVAKRSRHSAYLWEVLAKMATPKIDCPHTPWCGVIVYPGLARYIDSTEWLADFERCVAWAWVESNG